MSFLLVILVSGWRCTIVMLILSFFLVNTKNNNNINYYLNTFLFVEGKSNLLIQQHEDITRSTIPTNTTTTTITSSSSSSSSSSSFDPTTILLHQNNVSNVTTINDEELLLLPVVLSKGTTYEPRFALNKKDDDINKYIRSDISQMHNHSNKNDNNNNSGNSSNSSSSGSNNNNSNNNNNCEVCGWIASFCSMIAFGSFGVPIKSTAAKSVDIDPLVFQSYKTFLCFITSWIILFITNEELTFTPWGIISGLFWVPGGTGMIYAIKSAGLAIGIGVGSSCIVLISFIWGIFIFQEPVHSKIGACLAIVCMMFGLVGMSYFSSQSTSASSSEPISPVVITQQQAFISADTVPEADDNLIHDNESILLIENNDILTENSNKQSITRRIGPLEYQRLERESSTCVNDDGTEQPNTVPLPKNTSFLSRCSDFCNRTSDNDSNGYVRLVRDDESEDGDSDRIASNHLQVVGSQSRRDYCFSEDSSGVHLLGGRIHLSKRQFGIVTAAFCGIYGGSIMAPMKFAPKNTKGTRYLLSFSIGASIVTISLWIIRFLYNSYKYRSFYLGYSVLPSFHIRVMWVAGVTSGLLWSIGNYFSLISVLYLGQGVGYPLVQTSILVSGLWGIFYFKEVKGRERICKWFASSLLTLIGILLLTYEHREV